jgi:predicted nucleic acid-binding protein
MNPCFADSSYYFALLNPKDEAHVKAASITRLLQRQPIVTTHWVLTELGDGFASTPSRKLFAPLVTRLQATPLMTIIPADELLFAETLQLYENRSDKAWSFTDCRSFVVMQRHGIRDALTADHHFAQAGFQPLLS